MKRQFTFEIKHQMIKPLVFYAVILNMCITGLRNLKWIKIYVGIFNVRKMRSPTSVTPERLTFI